MFDVSRILAIPEYDDLPQMGLSKAGLAAIVERGGITKDGTKAKASVLQRAGIKGDRKLDEAKPRIKFEELNASIAAKVKKAIANLKPSDSKAKKEVKKSLRFLDTNKDYLERVNGKPLPKKPSANASYSEKFEREMEKKQIMKERQQAKGFVKESTESVAKAMRNAPKFGEFVNKKYGGYENVPRDGKGNIDQDAIARDFVNSPYADVKVRKATRKSKKVALQKETAIAQKSQAVSSKLNKIKSATDKLLNKESGSKKPTSSGEAIKRKKRAMTDRDIARNTGIASAKLEAQGQLNIFNQPKPSAAAIAPDTGKKVKRAKDKTGSVSQMSQQSKYSVGLANIGNGFPNNPKAIEAWASKHNVSLDNLIKEHGSGLTPQAAKKNSPEFLALTKAFYNDKPFVAPKKKTPNKGIKKSLSNFIR